MGHLEGNTVFEFLDAFGENENEILRLKEHYVRGGLGDGIVKNYLLEVLENFLSPIRKKRQEFSSDKGELINILKSGKIKAREKAAQTLDEVKRSMGIYYY